MAATGDMIIKIIAGTIASILTGAVGWLINIAIEVDRTQETLITRVNNIEGIQKEHSGIIQLIPAYAQDSWHKSQELLYQDGVDERLDRLELFHPPYKKE